jgi:hypothetical protein
MMIMEGFNADLHVLLLILCKIMQKNVKGAIYTETVFGGLR